MSQNLEDDWGWFVDIELGRPTLKKTYYSPLQPIVEQPTKSDQLVRKETLMFQMDDIEVTPKTKSKCSHVDVIIHIIGFTLCYFIL